MARDWFFGDPEPEAKAKEPAKPAGKKDSAAVTDSAPAKPEKAGGPGASPPPQAAAREPAPGVPAAQKAGTAIKDEARKRKKSKAPKPASDAKLLMLSPSQINTFLGCPRKWYFRYVLKIPEEESFAMARGTAAHYVAEHFFDKAPSGTATMKELEATLRRRGRMLLEEAWREGNIARKWPDESMDDASVIVDRFVTRVLWKLEEKMKKTSDPVAAWNFIAPARREMDVKNEALGLRGYIDAVVEKDGKVILLDYKTSSIFKHPHNDDYELQLLIYAILFEADQGRLPDVVSIEYLFTGETWSFPVQRERMEDVLRLVQDVRAKMASLNIRDYPGDEARKFCKWCTYAKECDEAERAKRDAGDGPAPNASGSPERRP